jgi:hypothetical protein
MVIQATLRAQAELDGDALVVHIVSVQLLMLFLRAYTLACCTGEYSFKDASTGIHYPTSNHHLLTSRCFRDHHVSRTMS